MTTVSRLSRANIRPLLLPAAGASPSLLKRLYDIAGTLTSILVVNFATAPFMLLNVRDSLHAWNVLRWYGFVIIFGGLGFFYAGGAKWLKSLHPLQVQGADTKKGKSTLRAEIPKTGMVLSMTTPNTPGSDTTPHGFLPPVDSAAKEWEKTMN